MPTTSLYIKVILVCYAIFSFPYVALALDLRATHNYNSNNAYKSRDSAGFSLLEPQLQVIPSSVQMQNFVVNSTNVVHNIPKDQQEVFYFRNFTMVGRKSEGFDINEWEARNNHPVALRALMTPAERQAAGDFNILLVAAAVVLLTITALGACIAIAPGCGAYIGANIGVFVTAVPGGVSGAGQAIVGVASAAAAAAGAGRRDLIEGRDTQDEDFGCYYQDSYAGTCTNGAVTQPAYSMVVDNDSNTPNTPDWTCYESKDSQGDQVFGYYSHCFGKNENCELQCGSGNPEVTGTVNEIPEPSN